MFLQSRDDVTVTPSFCTSDLFLVCLHADCCCLPAHTHLKGEGGIFANDWGFHFHASESIAATGAKTFSPPTQKTLQL